MTRERCTVDPFSHRRESENYHKTDTFHSRKARLTRHVHDCPSALPARRVTPPNIERIHQDHVDRALHDRPQALVGRVRGQMDLDRARRGKHPERRRRSGVPNDRLDELHRGVAKIFLKSAMDRTRQLGPISAGGRTLTFCRTPHQCRPAGEVGWPSYPRTGLPVQKPNTKPGAERRDNHPRRKTASAICDELELQLVSFTAWRKCPFTPEAECDVDTAAPSDAAW
jgi:hypothetical protein